jgi:putative molybdopterin biosynthesis protein
VDNKALTTQEVADILKIAKNTVYELVKRGELNSYKIGKNLRFSVEDVENYIAQSKAIKPQNSVSQSSTDQNKTLNYHLAGNNFVICGQDLMLDILSNYIERHEKGCPGTSFIHRKL